MSDAKVKTVPFEIGGKNYNLCFNLNAIQAVQEKYGDITDLHKEIYKAETIKWTLTVLINEAIDTKFDDTGEKEPHLTEGWVGRHLKPGETRRAAEAIVKAFNISMPDEEDDDENMEDDGPNPEAGQRLISPTGSL